MSGNTYNLKVDLKQKHTAIVPTFIQYDDARIDFQLFDNGKLFDLTGYTIVEVAHKRVDGTIVVGAGEIILNEKGQKIVRYDYQGSEMSKAGFIDTSFSIFDAEDNKVSIQPFKVHILKDNRDGVIDPANPEYGLLQTYQAELVTLKADMAAKIDETNQAILNTKAVAVYATTQGDYALEIAESNKNVLLSPVANFTAISTAYPNPVFGSKVQTTDNGKIYRWEGTSWKYVEEMNSNMLTDIQSSLATNLIKVSGTTPTGTEIFWLDTSIQ